MPFVASAKKGRTRLGLPHGRIGAIAAVHTSREKITWNPTTQTVIYRSKRHHTTKRNFEIFKAPDFIAAILRFRKGSFEWQAFGELKEAKNALRSLGEEG